MSINKNKPVRPRKGDIVGVTRTRGIVGNLYEHYGIYTGEDTVVQYTTEEWGFIRYLEVMETPFEKFIKSEKSFFILDFDPLKNPQKSGPVPVFNNTFSDIMETILEIREWLQKSQMNIYSPDETVQRARNRLGEKEYNLLFNNCEHFAVWCKTGLSKSYQIEKLLKVLRPNEGVFGD